MACTRHVHVIDPLIQKHMVVDQKVDIRPRFIEGLLFCLHLFLESAKVFDILFFRERFAKDRYVETTKPGRLRAEIPRVKVKHGVCEQIAKVKTLSQRNAKNCVSVRRFIDQPQYILLSDMSVL